MPAYDCDRCGACCRHLIVEADLLDLLREPRLSDADPQFCGRAIDDVLAELRDEFKVVIPTQAHGCAFLGNDNTCAIYPTRPNACVGLQAGDDQCQEARQAAGLRALKPRGA